MCGTIDFREYLLCALFLIKRNLSTMDLIEIVSKMYENCSRDGRLTRTAMFNLLNHMIGASIDECVDISTEIGGDGNGFITLGWYYFFLLSTKSFYYLFLFLF